MYSVKKFYAVATLNSILNISILFYYALCHQMIFWWNNDSFLSANFQSILFFLLHFPNRVHTNVIWCELERFNIKKPARFVNTVWDLYSFKKFYAVSTLNSILNISIFSYYALCLSYVSKCYFNVIITFSFS